MLKKRFVAGVLPTTSSQTFSDDTVALITRKTVPHSTAQYVAQNSKRERLEQQIAARCSAVLRSTARHCAAI